MHAGQAPACPAFLSNSDCPSWNPPELSRPWPRARASGAQPSGPVM